MSFKISKFELRLEPMMSEKEAEALLGAINNGFRKSIRFAVEGADGKQSGSWAAWGNKSDYYFGARYGMGSMKVSLHESGISRVAMLQSQIDDLLRRGLPVPENRAIVRWRRATTPLVGAACAASIKFPAKYLRTPSQSGTSGKPLLKFTMPSDAEAAEIGFFYSREAEETLGPKLSAIGQPLFITHLDNGEKVWFVARCTEFNPSMLPTAERLQSSPLSAVSSEADLENPDQILAGVFWNAPRDGEVLQLFEVGGVKLTQSADKRHAWISEIQ